jgi:hypothetical protein
MMMLSLLLACSDDKPIEDAGSDGGGGDGVDGGGADGGGSACGEDNDCGDGLICEGGTCVDGDRNNSVEEAEALLWSEEASGAINPAGDVDYYSFIAEGGEMVRIYTVTNNEYDGEAGLYSTVLTLRNPAGKILTQVDEFATGSEISGKDSVLFAYLAEAGSYIVTVEDVGEYSGEPPQGASDYTYTLTLEEWGEAPSEPDSPEEADYSLLLDEERIWYSVGFLIEEAGDVDYFGLDSSIEDLVFYLDGNDNIEGSDISPQVRLVRSSDGAVLSDKLNVGLAGYMYYPHLQAGQYHVEITDAEGTGGPDHWFFLHVIGRVDSSSWSTEAEPNDSLEAAGELALTEYENSGGNLYSSGLFEGVADAVADEDWFMLEAPYDESWLVVCLSSTIWGSAATPSLEIYDSAGELLGSGAGDASDWPTSRVENVAVSAGTYYLRVVEPEGTDAGPGWWYRGSAYAASFEVSTWEEGGYTCP